MIRTYSYTVTDVYNVFGGGHCYRITLYKDGEEVSWSDHEWWRMATRKIKKLEKVYGAYRA